MTDSFDRQLEELTAAINRERLARDLQQVRDIDVEISDVNQERTLRLANAALQSRSRQHRAIRSRQSPLRWAAVAAMLAIVATIAVSQQRSVSIRLAQAPSPQTVIEYDIDRSGTIDIRDAWLAARRQETEERSTPATQDILQQIVTLTRDESERES